MVHKIEVLTQPLAGPVHIMLVLYTLCWSCIHYAGPVHIMLVLYTLCWSCTHYDFHLVIKLFPIVFDGNRSHRFYDK